jgi:hypothetical protein
MAATAQPSRSFIGVSRSRDIWRSIARSLRRTRSRFVTSPATPGTATGDNLDRVRLGRWHAPKTSLLALLIFSFVLRVWLIVQGGQYYWPDERRYRAAQTAAAEIVSGDVTAALNTLQTAEHFLFKVIALIPALAEQAVGANSRIPALFLALFSVASIGALWIIARRLGFTEREALLAAFLLACSSTWLYYSRHLLPYDVALALGLFALIVALRMPAIPRDSWLCGLLCSTSFLSYAGYWNLAAFVMLTRVMWQATTAQAISSRAWHIAGGFMAPILALLVVSAVTGGDMLGQFVSFSRTVTQGEFDEGWSLPFAFLWHAEHGLAALWLLAFALGLYGFVTRRNRSNLPLAAVLFVYGTLVIASVGFEVFVVYGRTARQLVPFLCLIAAEQLYRLTSTIPRARRVVAIASVLIALQAIFNLWTPFSQVFPSEFRERAQAIAAATGDEPVEFRFADHIYPLPLPDANGGARVLVREPHPLQFIPYQYEGYSPHERTILRTTDIAMRAVLR